MRTMTIAHWSILMLFYVTMPLQAQDACQKKAMQAISKQNYDTALVILAECTHNNETFRLKGEAFYHIYKADSAVLYLEMVVASGKADDPVLIHYSEVLLWKKEFKKAGSLLDKVTNKTQHAYKNVFAMRLEMLGKFDEAIACYDSMIAKEKQPWATMNHKAEVLSWKKKFDESIALFTRVVDDPSAPRTLRMHAKIRRAEVTAWKGQSLAALSELDSVIAMDRKPASAPPEVRDRILDALQLKGQILEWTGKFSEARDAYKNMIIIAPDNKRAKLSLEKLLWVK